jgi:hypothetical protein
MTNIAIRLWNIEIDDLWLFPKKPEGSQPYPIMIGIIYFKFSMWYMIERAEKPRSIGLQRFNQNGTSSSMWRVGRHQWAFLD